MAIGDKTITLSQLQCQALESLLIDQMSQASTRASRAEADLIQSILTLLEQTTASLT